MENKVESRFYIRARFLEEAKLILLRWFKLISSVLECSLTRYGQFNHILSYVSPHLRVFISCQYRISEWSRFVSEIEYRAVVKEKQPLPREMFITSDRRVDDLERALEFRSPELLARSLPEQNRRVSGQPTKLGEPLKPYSSAVRPAHETELGGGLSRLIGGILPNSYYSRPQFRYPYYDTSGKERIQLISIFKSIYLLNLILHNSYCQLQCLFMYIVQCTPLYTYIANTSHTHTHINVK